MARKHYDAQKIREAAGYFYITGSLKKTSQALKIPITTLFYWRENNDVWADATETARTEKNEELDAMYTAIIDRSAEELTDRIENGDEVFDKSGNKVRRKISGKELAIINGTMYDKRALLRNQPTSISSKQGFNERLKEIQDRLKEQNERRLGSSENRFPGREVAEEN